MDEIELLALAAAAAKKKATPEKSFGQTLKENLIGDNDPTTQNTGEKIGSFINKAIEGATFGVVGDEAAAGADALMGKPYDQALEERRAQEELFAKENPKSAIAAEIGGAMAAPLGAIGAVGKGASMLTKAGASAAATGGLSGLYGFAEGEGGLRSRAGDAVGSAAVAAPIGAAIPVAGGIVQKLLDNRATKKAVRGIAKNAPTTEQLRTQGRAAYKAIDDAGVQIKPGSFSNARDKIVEALRGQGLDELPGPGSLTPKSARVVQIADEMSGKMAKEPTAALPFSSLDQLRRHAGTAASDIANKTEANVGAEAISQIDDFVRGLGADDIVAGDVKTLQETLPKARDLWARMSRSQLIDDAIGVGEDAYLSGSGTGVKYQFKKILKNPKLSRGFSEAEKKMMARVVNGTIPEQILRLAGSGLTQIGGTAAAAIGGGPIAALGTLAASTGARKLSDKVIKKNAEIVRALVAGGGLKQLPQGNPQITKIMEKLLRQGTAAALQ